MLMVFTLMRTRQRRMRPSPSRLSYTSTYTYLNRSSHHHHHAEKNSSGASCQLYSRLRSDDSWIKAVTSQRKCCSACYCRKKFQPSKVKHLMEAASNLARTWGDLPPHLDLSVADQNSHFTITPDGTISAATNFIYLVAATVTESVSSNSNSGDNTCNRKTVGQMTKGLIHFAEDVLLIANAYDFG
jgi:hypothetical protein